MATCVNCGHKIRLYHPNVREAVISLPEVRALLDGLRCATSARELWAYEREHDATHLLMDWFERLTEELRAAELTGESA